MEQTQLQKNKDFYKTLTLKQIFIPNFHAHSPLHKTLSTKTVRKTKTKLLHKTRIENLKTKYIKKNT